LIGRLFGVFAFKHTFVELCDQIAYIAFGRRKIAPFSNFVGRQSSFHNVSRQQDQ
jgi:hypothetical protein